jgi:acetyl-CoA acyltransferase
MARRVSRDHQIVVVDGCRTPFLRAGTDFSEMTSYELGCAAVSGLVHRNRLPEDAVDLLVMGTVMSDPATTNLAREVVLGAGLSRSCPAYTVTVACVSSLQAVLDGVRAILAGDAESVVAGGAELLSDPIIRFRRAVRRRLVAAQRVRGAAGYLKLLRGLKPGDLLPEVPAIAEFSTGQTMGQAAERLVKRLGITREEQDRFALESHLRAAKAREAGHLGRQIVPVVTEKGKYIAADNGIRGDTSMEKLARLRPAFDRRFGTVTAGNSSFLTDGAAAVLLMTRGRAEALGYEPLARVRSWAVTAMDPVEELLLGPAFSVPAALSRARVSIGRIGVIEFHEAFAGQIVANLKLLADPKFHKERLGRRSGTMEIDPERLNAWGGSLSVGHPFGATGARLVATCCQRMRAEDAELGLVAACAAGAIGVAMVFERV